jgi:AraC family transcriptional regulator
MTPRIENLNEKKLVGMRLSMSMVDQKMDLLWKSFLPRRRAITNNVTQDLISVAVYPRTHFQDFKPTNEFERWACIEVADHDHVPNDMQAFILPAGLYAVFEYKGLSTDKAIYQYIYGAWLPNADYVLDDRPHFEVLGQQYKNNDPASEEEIWIPITPK